MILPQKLVECELLIITRKQLNIVKQRDKSVVDLKCTNIIHQVFMYNHYCQWNKREHKIISCFFGRPVSSNSLVCEISLIFYIIYYVATLAVAYHLSCLEA